MIKKIVLAGPPRSGKSCLREGLKQAIKVVPGAPYPYVITACPDGEGSWFQEAMNTDPKVAEACKATYKSKFSPEFVNRIADSVRNCSLELTLIDIGGIPSIENEQICSGATHIVILSGNKDKFDQWQEFAKKVGLTVIAEIYSDYHGTEDVVKNIDSDNILRGTVHHLERGEQVSERPMIKALAQHLIRL